MQKLKFNFDFPKNFFNFALDCICGEINDQPEQCDKGVRLWRQKDGFDGGYTEDISSKWCY